MHDFACAGFNKAFGYQKLELGSVRGDQKALVEFATAYAAAQGQKTRSFGMTGKSAVSPALLPIISRVFSSGGVDAEFCSLNLGGGIINISNLCGIYQGCPPNKAFRPQTRQLSEMTVKTSGDPIPPSN
ncbi:hypothetical protein [Pseudomonas poae]|uniref:hypothetical protein n=1 Tax=Pseudomonas poae TaxID=200451 RepID=UPI0030DFF30C